LIEASFLNLFAIGGWTFGGNGAMSPNQEFESLKGSTVYLTGKTYLIFNFVGFFRIKVGTNSKISELKRLARVC